MRFPFVPQQIQMSADGERYLVMGSGRRVAAPFHLRWLIPYLLGTQKEWYRNLNYACVPVVSLLAWSYTHSWAAIFIPLGLTGVIYLNTVLLPVLIDLPAMTVTLAAAVCSQHHWWYLMIPLVLLAGMIKETSPVFCALWAWSFLPLVGLLSPALRALQKPGPDPLANAPGLAHLALTNPLRASWQAHQLDIHQMSKKYLLPWGILLIGIGRPTWQVALVIVAAYGQCFVATDTVRLYQWAWPVLAAVTFSTIPRTWWFLLVILHLANPFKTNGV